MKLRLERFDHDDDTSLGLLFVDGEFFCFTLEDQPQNVKVPGETRIPAGTYDIRLRDEGGVSKKYAAKFPGLHKGMLWLQDVPEFEWIYIHIGNTDDHTSGCILVGGICNAMNMSLAQSTSAYEILYKRSVDAAEAGDLTIDIIDRDI